MREKDIEHKLVTAVKRCGGAAVKFISPRLGRNARQARSSAWRQTGFCGIKGSRQTSPPDSDGKTQNAKKAWI